MKTYNVYKIFQKTIPEEFIIKHEVGKVIKPNISKSTLNTLFTFLNLRYAKSLMNHSFSEMIIYECESRNLSTSTKPQFILVTLQINQKLDPFTVDIVPIYCIMTASDS